MQAEIQIHRLLGGAGQSHQNIVKFHRFFEDEKNVYILLELCGN